MIVISGVGAIGCVVLLVLDKKGKIKQKEAVATENAPTVESTSVEQPSENVKIDE